MSLSFDAVRKRQFILMHKDIEVLIYDVFRNQQKVLNENLIPWGFQYNQFISWCANRVLSISRKNAKYILNTLGISQDDSDFTRARLALAYHCVSLNDCYWVKRMDDDISWKEVSLYDNKSENILTPVSLQGKVFTVFDGVLDNACDVFVNGTYRKSWIRTDESFKLYKGNDDNRSQEVDREVSASKVLNKLGFDVVNYRHETYDNEVVSVSDCFTSKDIEYIPFKDIKIKYGRFALKFIKDNWLDSYYKMAIATYIIGNIDLHDGNWGIYRDLRVGKLSFAKLFDFNNALTDDYLSGKDKTFAWLPEIKAIDVDTGEEVDDTDIFNLDIRYKSTCSIEDAAKIAAEYLGICLDTSKLSIEDFTNSAHVYECINRCNQINEWAKK